MSVKPNNNIRSVKDIRTHSGSIDQAAIPYKAYMRISCLEMEKARRLKEKKQAMARIDLIDSRIMEIEGEKQALKNELAQIEEGVPSSDSQPQKKKPNSRQVGSTASHSDNHSGNHSDNSGREGFKIRY
ncbi:hypothetical protein JWG39_15255 [Desulforhopalus vacuolatus]|uniref:hypothetical protein n=1 Tax=Desulforhopalus vacuolatus TaxID=40414 RepID=UPI001966C414|nr:hypothetical protein [Desulforhopalus vacuolatus]MBM9521177.1 hypothetical protein [Desulforhopalus vacuolatus]